MLAIPKKREREGRKEGRENDYVLCKVPNMHSVYKNKKRTTTPRSPQKNQHKGKV
jgi:hypothetical protein